MIQHVSRTTFPALFRSGSERTGIGGGDHEDGSARRCVVPHKMTFNRLSSSLRKTPLFRSSSSYKTKPKNTKNSTTSKDDHGMRTDAPTVTQLTPSPHYAARPVLTTEQPPPGGNHRSIPTVPELCIPNINTSTITNTTNNNRSSSSSRSQQLRLARIYSSRRSIEDEQEQEHEQADDDHPDFPWEDSTSFLFPSPPIQVVEIPPDFTHATAFGVTTERKQNTTTVERNNSSSSHNSTTNVVRRVLDRPPPRFGDWDDHTIASTTSCAKDVVMTDDSRAGGSARTAATVSVQTARDVITSFVDRRQRRRRTRSIRSIPMTTPAPMTNKNHGPPPQQPQQEHQWNENSEQQQLRGVKWNRVPPQHTTASPQPLPPGQPRVVRWNMVQPQPQPESEQQQQQQPPRVVKWNSVR